MAFELVELDADATDSPEAEAALLSLAEAGRCVAHLWQAPPSLVVPRSYRRFEALERARAEFAARGCPVHLRLSGGGLVPQGPGILNLSLAYPVRGTAGALSDAVYRHLCGILRDALGALGLRTHWQAVDGSFCNGRFNLAWGPPDDARKIAGTAQYWRGAKAAGDACDAGVPRYAVLAHAVLLVDADCDAINARANAFEAAIGSGRHYDARRVTSVRQALSRPGAPPRDGLMEQVVAALRTQVRAAPPLAGQDD